MKTVFGSTPYGEAVDCVVLEGGGLQAKIITWGAVLQDLRLAGHEHPLVLGFENFADYPAHSPYCGAIAGRCANRIGGARFTLDGDEFLLDANFLGKHTLHGGSRGVGKRVWTLDGYDENSARMSIRLADGEMGFPGAMDVRVTFRLMASGAFDIAIEAETDRPTLCNFAHHSYFNLGGEATINDHLLQIAADTYVPVDQELIPTGEVSAVAGTRFDFRVAKPIGDAGRAGTLDHNFCLSQSRTEIRPVAWLKSQSSGVNMEIRTTEPGLQVYDGAKIAVPVAGLGGRKMGANAGVALEPQIWPDAIHHPSFPQAILRPGETYRQHSQFVFTRGQA